MLHIVTQELKQLIKKKTFTLMFKRISPSHILHTYVQSWKDDLKYLQGVNVTTLPFCPISITTNSCQSRPLENDNWSVSEKKFVKLPYIILQKKMLDSIWNAISLMAEQESQENDDSTCIQTNITTIVKWGTASEKANHANLLLHSHLCDATKGANYNAEADP